MLLQIVHLLLLEVAEITYTEVVFGRDYPIEGEELSEGRGRDECSGYDVVIVVAAPENLVIALSEIG